MKKIYLFSILFIAGIFQFACRTYIISPGVRSDNQMLNIEKPSIIRNDKIKNNNLSVAAFLPKEKDLEEAFFDENNFSPENKDLRQKISSLWEKAKETKNVILIQIKNRVSNEASRQIKSIQLKLGDCEPIQSVSYQYDFIQFVGKWSGIYSKVPEIAYRDEMRLRAAYTETKEISTLRSIYIFKKDCRIDSSRVLNVTIQTDETLVFRFKKSK